MDMVSYLSVIIGNPVTLYDDVEWITVEDGKVDLRKSLLTCTESGHWISMIEYSYCDLDSSINHSPLTDF